MKLRAIKRIFAAKAEGVTRRLPSEQALESKRSDAGAPDEMAQVDGVALGACTVILPSVSVTATKDTVEKSGQSDWQLGRHSVWLNCTLITLRSNLSSKNSPSCEKQFNISTLKTETNCKCSQVPLVSTQA